MNLILLENYVGTQDNGIDEKNEKGPLGASLALIQSSHRHRSVLPCGVSTGLVSFLASKGILKFSCELCPSTWRSEASREGACIRSSASWPLGPSHTDHLCTSSCSLQTLCAAPRGANSSSLFMAQLSRHLCLPERLLGLWGLELCHLHPCVTT